MTQQASTQPSSPPTYVYDSNAYGYGAPQNQFAPPIGRTSPLLTPCALFEGETGLDYFGARYFSAVQGRWTSPDWSVEPQPVPYADFNDPQTLNLYSYVRNNPLSRTDPDGHCIEPFSVAACAVGLAAGYGIIKTVFSVVDLKNNLDYLHVMVNQANLLGERAVKVCGSHSDECGAAIENWRKARVAAVSRANNVTFLGLTLSGTLIGGPLPTSLEDFAISNVQDLGYDYLKGQQEEAKRDAQRREEEKRKEEKRREEEEKRRQKEERRRRRATQGGGIALDA